MDDGALDELVSVWQQEMARGRDLPATVICPDRPELAEELARRIEALRRINDLAGARSAATTVAKDEPARPGAGGPLPSLAGYELLGRLGEGGMGVVYRARQLRPNRLVAVKMLRAGSDPDPEHLERFRREAEALAQLQHPNIIPVYEVGEHGGLPYFCMELVDGGSLDRKLAGNPVPPREAAALVEVLARAIGAAHAKGIVHRDLKPGNILLGADGTPKISDFGLAKRLDGAAAPTVTGAVLGTPSYMAPEQAAGSVRDISPATDVYALGAVLYELLTGRPPFKSATHLDTLLQVKTHEPIGPRQLQPTVARDLEAVCLKCLEKSPPRRYPSAAALADDLRRFLDGDPTRARPVGPLGRAWRWSRRRPIVAGLLALLLAVVAGALSGLSALYLRAEEQRRRAEAEWARAEAEAEKARQSADEARRRADAEEKVRRSFKAVLLAMRESDPLGFLGGYGASGSPSSADPLVRSFLDRTAPAILRDPPADPVARAALLETVGDLYRSFGDLGRAAPLLEESLALRRDHLGEENTDYASGLHSLAWLYHDQGRYTAAEELYRQALALRRRLGDALGVDATLFNLAWLLTQLGEYAPAEEMFRQVLEGRQGRDGDASRPTAVAKAALAALYLDRGQPEKAIPWSKQAIATFIALDGNEGLWRAAALFQSALIQSRLPFGPDPVAQLKEALEIGDRSLGRDHPYNALVLHELARTLEEKKDDAEAEKYYRECLRVARATVGLGHPKAAIAVGSLAGLLGRTGRAAEADALFDELLAAHRKRFGPDHFLVADALVEYGAALGRRGDDRREKAVLEEAMAIYRKDGEPRGRLYALCLNNLGVVYLRAKRYADAERLLDEALPRVRGQYGESHPDLAQVLVNAVSARLPQGKTDGAEEWLREAEAISKPRLPLAPPPPLLDEVLAQRGDLYRRTGRLADAEAAALRRRATWPNDPDTLLAGARDLALLVPLTKEAAERDRRARLAVDVLRRAAEKGFKDRRLLDTDDAFAPLRDRDDYRRLLAGLGAKP
jgi:serine/threonine-protein kinase